MNDDSWRRHANPWSVYTRVSCLPLIVLAIWSRVWLGWWCILPLSGPVLWAWYNPRAFAPPRDFDHWPGKGTLGERLLLNHRTEPVPEHHLRAARLLAAASLPGVVLTVYGLVVLDVRLAVFGPVLTIMPKVWFVDRMVWLYEDSRRFNSQHSQSSGEQADP